MLIDIANLIALFSIIPTLLGILVAIRTNIKELNAQSYIEYTNKYDSLIERMPDNYWEKREEIDFLFPRDNKDLAKKLHSYFQLCCQQFYLHKNSLINNTIWEMWKKEISYNLRLNPLKTFWEENEINYFNSYKKFKKFVQDLHKTT